MTIIAGFKSREGIVVCADTQETVSGISKRNVPKLRFEPDDTPHLGEGIAAAFCGAGDNGPFIDKLIEIAWEDAQLATSLDEACEEIEKSIKRSYKEFGQIYQPGYCPTADLIFGVKLHNDSRLFSAHGPVVVEKEGHDSAGAGYYMADFLASRMYVGHLNIHQCVILAAYVLFQAKEHVEGCGGDSHIAILRNDGVSGRVDWKRVEAITKVLEMTDGNIGSLLLDVANLDMPSDEFKENFDLLRRVVEVTRDSKIDELRTSAARWSAFYGLLGSGAEKTDSFGLPLPKP